LSNFAPSAYLDPSAQLYLRENELFPPFYYMATFDIFAKTSSSTNQLLSPQELFALGRPLWDLLKPAEQKLLVLGGGITVPNWLKKPALAVLSSRISLDITAESHVSSELVAGFMGICVHVSEDQHQLLAFYPSEPILAEAAASLMQCERVFGKLLSFLLDALQTGYVKPGYCGELVAHLLLTIAWDQATKNKEILSLHNNKALGYTKDQKNYEDEIQGLPHTQRLANGLLAFTHFIPLTITYTPTQTELRSLFIRFAAVICKHNQAGVDLILPVWLVLVQDGSNHISSDLMSYFLIQIKNWNKFYDDDWPASATSKLSKKYVFKSESASTGEEGNLLPYLSLYLQLGAQKPKLQSLHIGKLARFKHKIKKEGKT
ncbi:3660_t:CDS:2, partial [Paraglomus brasilianum]